MSSLPPVRELQEADGYQKNWDRFCFSKGCFNITLHKTILHQMQYSFLVFLARNGTDFSIP